MLSKSLVFRLIGPLLLVVLSLAFVGFFLAPQMADRTQVTNYQNWSQLLASQLSVFEDKLAETATPGDRAFHDHLLDLKRQGSDVVLGGKTDANDEFARTVWQAFEGGRTSAFGSQVDRSSPNPVSRVFVPRKLEHPGCVDCHNQLALVTSERGEKVTLLDFMNSTGICARRCAMATSQYGPTSVWSW